MIIYQFIIKLYKYVIHFAALLGHSKAKLFVEKKNLALPDFSNASTIWIHAASAGEGNQAIPIARILKKKYNSKVVISFFSPSGYDFHKNSLHFDEVMNLPLDSKKNAQLLIEKLNPKLVIFIKNELWWNYLRELNQQNIPIFLVNASTKILNPRNAFLKFYQKKCLRLFTKIFGTSKSQVSNSYQLPIAKTIGDSKYESAFEIDKNVELETIKKFVSNKPCIIIGSSWSKEEEFLEKWLSENSSQSVKVIIAPHEIDSNRIKDLQNKFKNCCLYTDVETDANVMILNKIGILRNVYKYADIAIIGGGFNKGIHNILEAVAFNIPVVFGPKYQNFDEAVTLLDKELAFSFSNYSELKNLLDRLTSDTKSVSEIKIQLAQFIEQNRCISNEIVNEINESINPQTLNPK